GARKNDGQPHSERRAGQAGAGSDASVGEDGKDVADGRSPHRADHVLMGATREISPPANAVNESWFPPDSQKPADGRLRRNAPPHNCVPAAGSGSLNQVVSSTPGETYST